MTLIEFFEKDAIENICSTLIKPPDRVIFVGYDKKLMEKHAERYQAILAAKKLKVEMRCVAINQNKIQSIIDELSKIVEENDDCVFDLTGGEDLYLVATGIIFERYKNRKNRHLQMHRFNIHNNSIADVDQDGQIIECDSLPTLSVEENIRLYGGDIVYEEQRKNTTYRWDMTDDFKQDINTMWAICKQDVRFWNTRIGLLKAAEEAADRPDELTVSVTSDQIGDAMPKGVKTTTICKFLGRLRGQGLLTEYQYDDQVFSVTYKNLQVKRCLTVEGQVLEMKVYLAALEATEGDGVTKTYNDVMNGVTIDWDGNIHVDSEECDTENEIDIMMMHGMVPVFVSCKNGVFDNEELYKLNTVATRFGGKYAKKVLVATALKDIDIKNAEYLRRRAKDMGIRLVEGTPDNERHFTEMDDPALNRLIRNLCSG